MKLPKILALGLVAIMPVALFATMEDDRRIEDAAKASYNYRTVLKDKVKVEAKDGVVTLAGTVPDKDLKNLAEDTVNNLPGVIRVDNQITVVPPAPEHSDEWIAFKINTRLLLKANVSAANTHVAVKEGIVTLSGTAENLAQKELTESYVSDIEGVRGIKNDLVVAEPPVKVRSVGEMVDDASITAQVEYALLTHGSTSAVKTKVKTHEGVVVIQGEAGSGAEKALVTRLAESVRGVKSVTNEMTVRN